MRKIGLISGLMSSAAIAVMASSSADRPFSLRDDPIPPPRKQKKPFQLQYEQSSPITDSTPLTKREKRKLRRKDRG